MEASAVSSVGSGNQGNRCYGLSVDVPSVRGENPVSLTVRVLSREVAIATVITAAFVALQVRASLYAGTLSMPPTFDDVAYYVDAARRVRIFWRGDVTAVLSDYIANPPHAPGATILAAIGFLLLGVQPWAADVANAVPLFVFVLVLMSLFSSLPIWIGISAVLSILTIPIFGLAIVEFRPDMWCAGMTVFGTLVIVLCDLREIKTAVVAGLALAAALLMKPTFSPLALILFAVAAVLRVAPYLQNPMQRWPFLKTCLIIGTLGLTIAGPHYIFALHSLIDYYQYNLFGAGAQFWSPMLSKRQAALYYLSGPGGAAALGQWAYIGALTLAVPFVLLARRRRTSAWQALIVAVLAMIAYAIVTAFSNKSAYLGVIFPCYVAGAIVISVALGLRFLYSRKMTGGVYIVVGALLIFAVSTYRLPWLRVHGNFVFPAEITASRHQVAQEVASLLQADPAISSKTVMFAQFGSYLNTDVLSFIFLQKDLSMPRFVDEAFSGDVAVQRALVARAHYVVTLTRDYPDTISWLPSANVGEAFDALTTPQAGFELEKTIIPNKETGAIRIYKRFGS